MKELDLQMKAYAIKLHAELRIDPSSCNRLASVVAEEVLALADDTKLEIEKASPIGIKDRWDELVAFQYWMDSVNASEKHPAVIRAQVIVQNYVCFVYLGESVFKTLRQKAASGSTLKKCCTFLTDNPVRAFRNAVAHANWKYDDDFSGIDFWAKKGSDASEPMVKWEVKQHELTFWQTLSRCVAYTVFEVLK